MGKGLNKARNKAADLARKMELARKEKEGGDSEGSEKSIAKLSEAEIKKKNDRLRFKQLLQQESANVLNAYSKDGYLSKEQEEDEISAVRKCWLSTLVSHLPTACCANVSIYFIQNLAWNACLRAIQLRQHPSRNSCRSSRRMQLDRWEQPT